MPPREWCVWPRLAAFVVQLLEPIEAVAAIPHHLAGLADIGELLGQLQQAHFRPNDLLLRQGPLLRDERGRPGASHRWQGPLLRDERGRPGAGHSRLDAIGSSGRAMMRFAIATAA